MPLWKKGPGWAIHNSGFIVEQTGCLALSPKQIAEQEKLPESKWLPCYDSQEIIYPGKNGDRWWNCDNLVDQIFESGWLHLYHWLNMQVKRVIPLFEYIYPNAVAEFIFDQSSAHGAFAPDALNAKEMNVNPGGKQHRMHSTIIPNDVPNPAVWD